MLKRTIPHILFFFLLAWQSTIAEIPQISLLTVDSGDELYNTFGHSGIRISHPETKYDVVYGYGTYSFNQDNFYLNFCQGKLLYHLSQSRFEDFIAEYDSSKRDVIEQVFDLDSIQTFLIIDYLEKNYKKENRYYKYDFFFDNCSTRIRDIFEDEFIEEWTRHIENVTYRDMLDEKLVPLVWSDFGIDLVIGAVADRKADYRTQMFLPSYLMDLVAKSSIDRKPMVKETNQIISFPEAKAERWEVPFLTPFKVFMALLFLLLVSTLINNTTSRKLIRVSTVIWYVIMAILSLVIILLWFFTDHLATKENWNLIWISPLFIIGLVRYRSLTITTFGKYILYGILGASIIGLVSWTFVPQRWHVAFLPMMLISIVLVLNQLREGRKNTNTKC